MACLGLVFVLSVELITCHSPDSRHIAEFAGLSRPDDELAETIASTQPCSCGCKMMIHNCRLTDPRCTVSRSLATVIRRRIESHRPIREILAELHLAGESEPLASAVQLIRTVGSPSLGNESSKVVIVEFADFQCPYCILASREVNQVLAQFPGRIRFVFKHLPLSMHSRSMLAARAATAANVQRHFWDMHDRLFQSSSDISESNVKKWAAELGLDMSRFSSDLSAIAIRQAVNRDLQDAASLKVEGTPTFYINGRKLQVSFTARVVSKIVSQEFLRQDP